MSKSNNFVLLNSTNRILSEYDKYFYQRTLWRKDLAKECKQITAFMSSKNSNNSRVTPRRVGL